MAKSKSYHPGILTWALVVVPLYPLLQRSAAHLNHLEYPLSHIGCHATSKEPFMPL